MAAFCSGTNTSSNAADLDRSAIHPPSSGRHLELRLPCDRVKGTDIAEEALATAIDEDLAGETVPDVIQHQDAFISVGKTTIFLDRRADEPRHDAGPFAKGRAEPADQATIAQHVFEMTAIGRHQELVHLIEAV